MRALSLTRPARVTSRAKHLYTSNQAKGPEEVDVSLALPEARHEPTTKRQRPHHANDKAGAEENQQIVHINENAA